MHRHPDECVAHLLDVAPTVVTTAAKHQREELKNPPGTVDEFLATLEQQCLYGRSPFFPSSRSRYEP